jgi:hypothetical protein
MQCRAGGSIQIRPQAERYNLPFVCFVVKKTLCSPWRAKALFQRDGGCVLPPSFTSARQAAVKKLGDFVPSWLKYFG